MNNSAIECPPTMEEFCRTVRDRTGRALDRALNHYHGPLQRDLVCQYFLDRSTVLQHGLWRIHSFQLPFLDIVLPAIEALPAIQPHADVLGKQWVGGHRSGELYDSDVMVYRIIVHKSSAEEAS